MKTSRLRSTIAFVSIGALIAIQCALAAGPLNFSGKYSEIASKSVINSDSGLEVLQDDSGIEITRVESEGRTTSRCPFGGADGNYVSPRGIRGTCKAYLKGRFLFVESLIVTHPQPAGSSVRIHTKERWELAADSKTLTIKSDSDFPDFPPEISGAVSGDTSYVRKFLRTNLP